MTNETEPLPTPSTETPARPRRAFVRPLVIGVAAGLAVVGLGVGVAVVADVIDSDDTVTVQSRDDSPIALELSATSVPTPTAPPMPVDDDTPITDAEREAVTAAALTVAGGEGTIEELKREDDGTVAWEVDVRLPNGAKLEIEFGVTLDVVSMRIDD